MERGDHHQRPRVVRGVETGRGPRVVRGEVEPPSPPGGEAGGEPPGGRLAELAARLEKLDGVPLSEHPDLFEELDALLAEELAGLDEV